MSQPRLMPRGGVRKGAGRKPAPEPLFKRSITLPWQDIGDLLVLGEGNLSRGVRVALDIARRHTAARSPAGDSSSTDDQHP